MSVPNWRDVAKRAYEQEEKRIDDILSRLEKLKEENRRAYGILSGITGKDDFKNEVRPSVVFYPRGTTIRK